MGNGEIEINNKIPALKFVLRHRKLQTPLSYNMISMNGEL